MYQHLEIDQLKITSTWRILKEKEVEKVNLEKVEKKLRNLPEHIRIKLHSWVRLVERSGIKEARKVAGYHDEPLKGNRHGQRSVRLSRSYRAIYIEENDDAITVIVVLEVNKHDY